MRTALLVAAVLLALAPVAEAQTADPRGVDPNSANPLLGQTWWVNKGLHPAWRQYHRYRRRGQRHRAALMWKIAREPKFHWFGR